VPTLRDGYTVAYEKKDVPYVGTVLTSTRRRQVAVMDHLGGKDSLQLKSIDMVLPTVGDKLTAAQLLAVYAFARDAVEANAADVGGTVCRAWERVIATAADAATNPAPASAADAAAEAAAEAEAARVRATRATGAPVPPGAEGALLSIDANTDEFAALSCLDLAPYVFPPADEAAGVALAEKSGVPVEVVYAYATHRLLSADGFFFKPLPRGAFAPRQLDEVAALRREVEEQAGEDDAQVGLALFTTLFCHQNTD
jgi:hypothetical protein